MTYQTAFPDFTLDVAIPEGFEDQSWHNDAMPRFVKTLSDGRTLNIWIDYADRSLSDYPELPRFLAEILTAEGEYTDENLATNDWQELLATVSEYK